MYNAPRVLQCLRSKRLLPTVNAEEAKAECILQATDQFLSHWAVEDDIIA